MLKVSGVYIPFNETKGIYIKDSIRPEYQRNIRDGSLNSLVWEWDPYVPIMCNGPHEMMYQTQEQYFCGCKYFTVTI